VAAANFLTALVATLIFKLALFGYSLSGAEGVSSALLSWPRLVLCLGWDVVSAAAVAAIATTIAVPFVRRAPALAVALCATVQAIYALFLVISFHVAVIVGAPLDKAAIDLLFFYNATPGRAASLAADSVLPYVTRAVASESAAAIGGAAALLVWLARRPGSERLVSHRLQIALATSVFLTIVAVPAMANGIFAVHTFGLERSPLTMLAMSYARGPLRAFGRRDPVPADPYCLDQRSPLPVDGDNPLRRATPGATNLVLVILESISSRSVAQASTTMPTLDELGRAPTGVHFDAHYTHWAQTMKAAFSIWCSELPHPDYPPITYVNPAIPCVSLSEALKSAGYDTAFFSSADLAFDRQIRFLKHRQIDVMFDRNDMPGREGAWENAWGMDERVTTRALLDWIGREHRERPERRFFATYNMAAGHHPYEFPGSPSPRWLDHGAEASAQRATLRFVDDRLREIVDGLARIHLRDSTLIAVVSDHGPGSGRAGMGSTRDASIYEGSVHVPFVLNGPQLEGANGAVTLPTGHIDIAPTIVGLLGLEPPTTMKGRELTHDSEPRVIIMAARPPLSQVGIRAGRWKLVHWGETGANELFDVAADPDERLDVASSHRDIVSTLDAIGERWQVHSRNLIENYAEVLSTSGRRCSTAR
jgi:arylsulfatase A-like enzyme